MFLSTVLFLGVVTAAIELYIFCRFNLIRQAIERWLALGLVFSMGLAIVLCAVFGAHGVTAMFAGIVSLIITQPIYVLWNAKENGKLDKVGQAINPKNWALPKMAFWKRKAGQPV